ncbi:MAG: hypothetical protein RXR47_05235 [Nitrososphaeria archaeon]
MSEVGMVGSLIEQAPSLGFRMRTVALDSGLRSASAARYLSRFKFISAVPMGEVGIRGELDGRHRTRSKGLAEGEQVDFRLIVSRRRAGLEPAGHRAGDPGTSPGSRTRGCGGATSTMSMYSAPAGAVIPNASPTALSEGPSRNSAVRRGSPLLLSSVPAAEWDAPNAATLSDGLKVTEPGVPPPGPRPRIPAAHRLGAGNAHIRAAGARSAPGWRSGPTRGP